VSSSTFYMPLRFVGEFKYLGHIIKNKFTDDDDDMKHEMRNMFMRLRRYSKCSLSDKLTTFKAYKHVLLSYWSVVEFFT